MDRACRVGTRPRLPPPVLLPVRARRLTCPPPSHTPAVDESGAYYITREFVEQMMEAFRQQQLIHRRFAFEIILGVRLGRTQLGRQCSCTSPPPPPSLAAVPPSLDAWPCPGGAAASGVAGVHRPLCHGARRCATRPWLWPGRVLGCACAAAAGARKAFVARPSPVKVHTPDSLLPCPCAPAAGAQGVHGAAVAGGRQHP
jgi:hypothetical protein